MKYLIVLMLVVLMGCQSKSKNEVSKAGNEKLTVYTTFYPTKYFTEQIGGDKVNVICPVPSDEDAIFWQPSNEVVQEYQKADLIVLNGAKFAKWVEKVSLPMSKTIDTAQPFEKDFVRFENAVKHSHGPAGTHSHQGIDGHTWLDPVNAKIQANEIKKRLIRSLPEAKDQIVKNYQNLCADLDKLDQKFKSFNYKDQPIFASHPAYNYLAKRYGWNIISFDLDPEAAPSPEVLASIKTQLKSNPAKYIIWESYPTGDIAKNLEAATGLTSVELSPCELVEAGGDDYIKTMNQNIENISVIFE